MRILKITIFAALILTFAVLFGIGYVWREIAFTSHTIAPVDSVAVIATTTVSQSSASTTSAVQVDRADLDTDTESSPSPTPTTPTPLSEPITVSTADLPETQRAILDTLGMDGASITITPKMVECAIDALGAARVDEIQKGDAPSLSEGLTLIACMKK